MFSKSKSKSSLLLDPDFDFDFDGSNPRLLRSYKFLICIDQGRHTGLPLPAVRPPSP